MQLEGDREDIGHRLDSLGSQRKGLQQAEDSAQMTLNQLELEKEALYRQVLKHQRAVKRFQALEAGRYMAGTLDAVQQVCVCVCVCVCVRVRVCVCMCVCVCVHVRV